MVRRMILINVIFTVKDEHIDTFMDAAAEFTAATRAEEGNLSFEWYHSTERPEEFVLVEAFRDDAAEAHVQSDHFRKAQQELPQYLVKTPSVINNLMEGKTEWDTLVEFEVPR